MPRPPTPRQLSLPVEALLHRSLGKSVGVRADIVQLCAALSLVRVRVRVRVGGLGSGLELQPEP